jgi:hypothetical protein
MEVRVMAQSSVADQPTYSIDFGRVVDFGSCYAQLALTIDGSVGIKLTREQDDTLTAREAEMLGKFLIQQSRAIHVDAMRRKDWCGRTLPRGLVVYLISDGNGLFKIGKAADVSVRMRQLQTGNGRRLQLIAFCMCVDEQAAYQLESSAHRSLARKRSVGEWFECHHVDALNAIYAAKAATGVGGAVRVAKGFLQEATDGAAQS